MLLIETIYCRYYSIYPFDYHNNTHNLMISDLIPYAFFSHTDTIRFIAE